MGRNTIKDWEEIAAHTAASSRVPSTGSFSKYGSSVDTMEVILEFDGIKMGNDFKFWRTYAENTAGKQGMFSHRTPRRGMLRRDKKTGTLVYKTGHYRYLGNSERAIDYQRQLHHAVDADAFEEMLKASEMVDNDMYSLRTCAVGIRK